jgi:tetratricopeptide (TPR) repeat protein
MALNFIFNTLSRKNKNKIYTFLKGVNLMNIYQSSRNKENPLEVLFNIGRFKQFIGHDKEAMKYYDSFFNKIYQVNIEENLKEKLEKTVYYNYAMMLKKSGNEMEAHKMLLENIVI